jgi:2-isopropylmalate synthase
MIHEGLHLGPANAVPSVMDISTLPRRVIINDCTLRDGEQTANVNFTLEDKIRLACRLEGVGIHQLQIGYPGRSRLDAELAHRLKNDGCTVPLEGLVLAYTDGWKDEIDATVASGVDWVKIIFVSSDLRLKHVFHLTREAMKARSLAAITRARDQGARVNFSPADATRADIEFLIDLVGSACEAGAGRICISDTLGSVSPRAMSYLMHRVRRASQAPLVTHCHNDFGLALANTLAAVEAGTEVIDCTLMGLGDRCGNAALEQVVLALEAFYGFDLGIRIGELYDLCQSAAKIAGIDVPVAQPLVGEYAFAHKLETHVQAILAYPPAYESISPDVVGNRRRIVLGRYSGPASLRARLGDLGLQIPDAKLSELQTAVERLTAQKKAALTDEDLRILVAGMSA